MRLDAAGECAAAAGAQAAAVGMSHAAVVRHIASTAAMRQGLPPLPPPGPLLLDEPSVDEDEEQIDDGVQVRR